MSVTLEGMLYDEGADATKAASAVCALTAARSSEAGSEAVRAPSFDVTAALSEEAWDWICVARLDGIAWGEGKGKMYVVEEVDAWDGDGDDDEVGRDSCAERGGDESDVETHGYGGILVYVDVGRLMLLS
jgi:hypothetical protein